VLHRVETMRATGPHHSLLVISLQIVHVFGAWGIAVLRKNVTFDVSELRASFLHASSLPPAEGEVI